MPHLDMDDEWEAQNDVRILDDAQQIQKSPQRLARARSKAKEQMEAAARVAEIDTAGNEDMMRRGFRKLS